MSGFMQNLETKFFTTSGRLTRKPFIIYIITFLAFLFSFMIFVSMIKQIFSFLQSYFIYISPVIFLQILPTTIFIIYLLLIIMASLPFNFIIIRRLHDLNHSGWWIILPIIIPPIYIPFILYLCLKKGNILPNQYGNSPLDK